MKIKIYIVTHKEFKKPKNQIYRPVLAGSFAYDKSEYPGFIYDDTGDNISNKHDLYSEFTVLYWMWKNSGADIIGENHYRRYFLKCETYRDYRQTLKEDSLETIYNSIIDKEYIEEAFSQGYNCILPKKCYHPGYTMYDIYRGAREDATFIFDSIRRVIGKLCPDYLDDFDEMLGLRRSYFKCINVMDRMRFNAFCSWIFEIYSALEDTGFCFKDREFAFIGEWLMNVWVLHNTKSGYLKVKELYFINTDSGSRYAFSEVTNTDFRELLHAVRANELIYSAKQSLKKVLRNRLASEKKETE